MTEPAAYQVLARKYRPRAFQEVVGQTSVVSTLRNAISQGRLHHAYLFSGTRGVGKTTLARLFARSLNCVKGPTVDPCGACDPCREIIAGSSMDVIEIDGASNRKVEDVDPLREAARYAPARDRHKVFLIDEVHMLSETAFNALLKVLEEPPPRIVFLFATTEPEKVPDTIMSRCLHLACRRVSRQEIAAALARTAGLERIDGTPEAFDLIAGLAAGSMRDGLSLLDQAIAYSGASVDGDAVRAALGLIDRGIVAQFVESIGRQDAAGALAVIETLSEAGADLTHFSREALSRVRDAMVCKAAGDQAGKFVSLSPDEIVESARVAGLFSGDGLLRLMHAMLELVDRIRRDEQPRFLLEASALKMIRLVDLTPIEDLLRRLEGKGGGAAPAPPAPSTDAGRGGSGTGPTEGPTAGPRGGGRQAAPVRFTSVTPVGRAPESEAAPPPGRPSGSRDIARLLERIGERRLSLTTFLGQARGISIQQDAVVITVGDKQGFVKNALSGADNLDVIREEAAAVFGRPMDVRIAHDGPPSDDLTEVADRRAGDGAPNKRDRLIDEAMNEPVVRTVMEMFKGQIVDIREGR